MKKLLLLLFSVIISFSSYAEWVYIDKNQDSGTKVYVLTDTIYKVEVEDGYVYWTDLNNYTEPQAEGMISTSLIRQGDCKNNRFVNIEFQWFKGSMATGEVGGTFRPEQEWTSPKSGTIEEKVFNFVCDYVESLRAEAEEKPNLEIINDTEHETSTKEELDALFEFQLPEKFDNTALKVMMNKPASVWDLGYLKLKMKIDEYLLDTDYEARPQGANTWINAKGGLNFSLTMPGGWKNHEVFRGKDLAYKCEIMRQHFTSNLLGWNGNVNEMYISHRILGELFNPFGSEKQRVTLGELLLADSTLKFYDWNQPSKVNCEFKTLEKFNYYRDTVIKLDNVR